MTPKVNAVSNAYLILKCLADQKDPMGVTHIARATGISASSTFSILKTLVDLQLVMFRHDTKRYELGSAIFELARNGMSNSQIRFEAQPILERLAERYMGQSGLWEIVDGNRILIAMGESAMPARVNIQVGQTFPIGAGSAGRAFLSKYSENRAHLKRAFSEVDWRGTISFENYEADVKKAARRGYAIDRDTLFPGLTTISSAFTEPKTNREFGITVFLLSSAHSAAALKSIGQDVLSAASELVHTTTGQTLEHQG